MTDLIVETENISKTFDRVQAVDNVSMRVPLGSIYGFIGQNGAGKSTTLKTLMGLIKAERGTARVLGQNAWGLPVATKQRIAYVPEVSFHFSWLTIQGMMDYVAHFYPHWNKKLAAELLDAVNLQPNKAVKSLSLGQMRSLSLIIALACNPDVLILDEPAGNLDVVARRFFQQRILDFAGNGDKTVLISSHILTDLERVVDRVGIIHRGKILIEDELDHLKEKTTRLHLTYAGEVPERFDLPGIVQVERFRNEARITVQDFKEVDIPRYASLKNARLETQSLNLEDIFVAYASGNTA